MNKKEDVSYTAHLSNHQTYYEIAKENYHQAKLILDGIQKKQNEEGLTNDTSKWTEEQIEWTISQTDKLERCSIVCVVFSSLSVEAYINHYAIMKSSKQFLEKYLDKLDLAAKWIIIPQYFNGRTIATGEKAFEKLRSLVVLRNKLVHYKTRSFSFEELSEEMQKNLSDSLSESFIGYPAAKISLEAVQEIIKALSIIDNEVVNEGELKFSI